MSVRLWMLRDCPKQCPCLLFAGDGGGAAVCKYFQFLAFFCDSRETPAIVVAVLARFSGSFILIGRFKRSDEIFVGGFGWELE